jgi:hypothetical protein
VGAKRAVERLVISAVTCQHRVVGRRGLIAGKSLRKPSALADTRVPAGALPPLLALAGCPTQSLLAERHADGGAVGRHGRGRVCDQVVGVHDDRVGAASRENGLVEVVCVLKSDLRQG